MSPLSSLRKNRMQSRNYLQLVELHAVEGEVLVVDGVERAPHHPRLHLVLLLGQQLQLYVGIAEI
jgi:hypothetical protein